MKKFFEKWYMSLFIVPILLTFFSSLFEINFVLSNWKNSIIISFLTLILLLIYEIVELRNKVNELQKLPNEKDKLIINKLLETLNLKQFQEDICDQDSWIGYKRESFWCITDFQYEVKLIENRILTNELNILVENFNNELNKFTEYVGGHMFGSGDWLIPFKIGPTKYPYEKAIEDSKIINNLSKNCFNKLEELMNYLRLNNYF